MNTKEQCAASDIGTDPVSAAPDDALSSTLDHDLVVELLKVFATLDRAMSAHRQHHMTEASRLAAKLRLEDRLRGRPSPAQVQLAIELSERGPGTISNLAARLRVSASAISLLVDRMVTHGMVERVRQTDDRRVVQVHLSSAASEMTNAVLRVVRVEIQRFVDDTPVSERQLFLRHFDRFARTLDTTLNIAAAPPPTPETPFSAT